MQSDFKDYFSKQSDLYLKYRPLYPKSLYLFLSGLCMEHLLAWDCGTGNGQAAIGLADHFDKVKASDASVQQIRNAITHSKVEYSVEKAENSTMENNSADLITISNALHWFDFEKFYAEVRRVLKSKGILAAWSYAKPTVSNELNSVINRFHDDVLGPYWLTENKLVEDGYRDLPFPFRQISVPKFFIEMEMDLNSAIGYFNTWSATHRYIRKNKVNPTVELENELKLHWGNADSKLLFRWEIFLKVGYLR